MRRYSTVVPGDVPGRKEGSRRMSRLNVVVSVNAAWNIWNFRRAVIEDLQAAGHAVTVLAPPDDSVADLEALGCRFVPLIGESAWSSD